MTMPKLFHLIAYFHLIIMTLFLAACSSHKSPRTAVSLPSDIHSGDLVFLDMDCGDLCQAIEDVTLEQFEVKGPRLSHVGMIEVEAKGEAFVWEAWPEGGVHKVTLRKVLERVAQAENKAGGFYIGRFRDFYRKTATRALQRIKKFEGKKYDEDFFTR